MELQNARAKGRRRMVEGDSVVDLEEVGCTGVEFAGSFDSVAGLGEVGCVGVEFAGSSVAMDIAVPGIEAVGGLLRRNNLYSTLCFEMPRVVNRPRNFLLAGVILLKS